MQVQFVIGNEIKYSTKLNMTREELFKDTMFSYNQKQKFKIPINKNQLSSFTKQKRPADDEFDDEEESSYSSDSFDAMEELEEEDEDKIESVKSSEDFSDSLSNKKHLRKYKSEFESNTFMQSFSKFTESNIKPRRELTEDEIVKKNDQILKRKLHAKKMLEEEKRQTVEKILNEDGRKLRERQKKLNEEAAKKEQLAEENYKMSLTKIKLKHRKDGKIYLRFPQGLLLPKVLMQKNNPKQIANNIQKCQVLNCENDKKYRDPVTKLCYCSVNCYKLLKNYLHIN